jgi:hypothetical protein
MGQKAKIESFTVYMQQINSLMTKVPEIFYTGFGNETK